MPDTSPRNAQVRWRRWSLPVIVAIVLAVVGVVVGGPLLHVKARAVVAGAVTLGYDPGSGDFSISADPLQLASRWVTFKLGDEIHITPDDDAVFVVIRSPSRKTVFQVPDGGSWRVQAEELVGPALGINYDASRRQFDIDLSHAYARSIRFTRTDGADDWDERPSIARARTHTVTVDTSKLTTGNFSYCKRAANFCNLYLHSVASLSSTQRVITSEGDPVSIPNGTRLKAICEAGGDLVRNDDGVGGAVWEYVFFRGYVGYVPATWTGSYNKKPVRVCGSLGSSSSDRG